MTWALAIGFTAISKRLLAYAEKNGRGYPDWATRYVPLVRRIEPWLKPDSAILEIGANENGLSRFSGRRVVALDISADHLAAARAAQSVWPVVASADAMPFRGDSFDIVCCVDSFEHMPNAVREEAVSEISRVLDPAGTAVVCFPSGAAAFREESRIRRAYERVTGNRLRWLEEHVETGLPDADAIVELFESKVGNSHRVARRKNLNARLWSWMWLVLMCNWPGRGNAFFQVALRWLTPVLTRCHFGDCYRAMIWVEPK